MEDREIIDLYWERSESAITETSNKYGRYCKTIALRILSSEQDSEECVNDTYLGAWNAMPPQCPSYLAVFLGRITRNIALDKFAYKTAKKRNGEFDVILSELGDCVASQDDVEASFDEAETAGAINRFLLCIDADNRNVFLRRYWYADSVSDISSRFQISESKVKSMLFRTRKRLKTHLEKEGVLV